MATHSGIRETIRRIPASGVTAVALCGFALALNGWLVAPLHFLPSPLFGGDLWHQLGQTTYILRGGSPLASGSIPGSQPVYLPLYSTLAAFLGRALGVEAFPAELVLSFAIAALGTAVMFALLLETFESPAVAACGALLHLAGEPLPVFKYTELARFLMVPLLLWMLLRFWREPGPRRAALLGGVYGLVGLSHGVAFVAVSLFLAGACAAHAATLRATPRSVLRVVGLYAVVCAVGAGIALAYWYRPIFVHHGRMSPHYLEWNAEDWASSTHRLSFALSLARTYLWSFEAPAAAARSVLVSLGVAALAFRRNRPTASRLLPFAVGWGLLLTLHAFVTEPLLQFHFLPNYVAWLLLEPLLVVLATAGIDFAFWLLSLVPRPPFDLRWAFAFVAICGAAVIGVASARERRADPQFRAASELRLDPYVLDVARYVDEHAPLDAVILTSKELGFALNALTGRKLVVNRRAHTDPYQPVDEREVDAATVLYGRDTASKPAILARYGVRYVYWEREWVNLEFKTTGGRLLIADPLVAFDTPERRRVLAASGVAFQPVRTWVDPAMRGPAYRQFDLLVVTPSNYTSAGHPWRPDLDAFLRKVWSRDDGAGPLAALYEVVLP